MKIFYMLVMLLLVPFSVFGLSDFAGQGKSILTWDDLMKPTIEPSRYFAVPGRTGDGVHPEGGYTKPVKISDKKEPVITPDVPKPQPKPEPKPQPKPDVKPEPKPQPKPDVKPCPKPEPKPCPKPDVKPCPTPDVKPCPKPDIKPCPKVKPCVHDKKKCTPHVRPECKKAHSKPSCDKPSNHHNSDNNPSDHSCKPAHTMGHMGHGICGQHNGRVGGFGRPSGHRGGNGSHGGKR